jgi:hypothetical protein
MEECNLAKRTIKESLERSRKIKGKSRALTANGL